MRQIPMVLLSLLQVFFAEPSHEVRRVQDDLMRRHLL